LEKKRHPRTVAMQGTCSCLGIECPRFPSDENIISKLAVAVYTNRGGPVEDRGLRIFEEVLQLQVYTIRFVGGHEEKVCFRSSFFFPKLFYYHRTGALLMLGQFSWKQ